MEKKTTPKRRSTRTSNLNNDIQKRSMEAVPRWALAVCAVILVMSFAIRQIGLDITTPINRIMSAHAVRIEAESRQIGGGGASSIEVSELQEKVHILTHQHTSFETRIEKLEHWSHPAAKKK
ncbi:hypothetical protein [Marinomonas balearica]|uniref:Uncharacterized protein n=1 Tax=Marinomonas balearica TaxID=491947 RepID=A0A4R6M7T5_9GAMM|nr:hypothetical protein [Marinomonas balearica]TDO96680.1 hypothetical protein DFP79_2442 [Marinomonas balearica]